MAWGSKDKTIVPAWTDTILEMDEEVLGRLLKKHRGTPFKKAKDLKKFVKENKRPIEGERGMAAIKAAIEGGGTGNKNRKNVPVVDTVHPSRRQAELDRRLKKAKGAELADLQTQDKQNMLARIRAADGNRNAQLHLRAEAERKGYI